MNEKTLENHKMFRRDSLISITINPSQQYFNCNNLNNRLLKFTSYWTGKLEACPAKEFEFDLEMSKTGRLHYHGYAVVNDSLELGHWFGKIKDSKNNLDIDTVGCLDTWKKYIRKDNDLFRKYTKLFRIYYPLRSDKPHNPYFKKVINLDSSESSDDDSLTDSTP